MTNKPKRLLLTTKKPTEALPTFNFNTSNPTTPLAPVTFNFQTPPADQPAAFNFGTAQNTALPKFEFGVAPAPQAASGTSLGQPTPAFTFAAPAAGALEFPTFDFTPAPVAEKTTRGGRGRGRGRGRGAAKEESTSSDDEPSIPRGRGGRGRGRGRGRGQAVQVESESETDSEDEFSDDMTDDGSEDSDDESPEATMCLASVDVALLVLKIASEEQRGQLKELEEQAQVALKVLFECTELPQEVRERRQKFDQLHTK